MADFDRAIRYAARLSPDAYHNPRRMSGSRLGQYEEAMADFDRAIRLQPDFASRLLSVGARARAELGQYEEAVADYDQALRLQPDNYVKLLHHSKRCQGRALVNTRKPSPTWKPVMELAVGRLATSELITS